MRFGFQVLLLKHLDSAEREGISTNMKSVKKKST
jgi:hypothetical protein